MGTGLTVEMLVRLYCAEACARSTSTESATTLRSRRRKLLALDVVIDGELVRVGQLAMPPQHGDPAPVAPVLTMPVCQQLIARTDPRSARYINDLVGMLRSAIRWSIASGLWSGPDPTAAIRYRKETHASRVLSEQQIRGILHGLDVCEALGVADLEWIDFPRILFGWGVRPGDLRAVRTADVDLAGRWIVTKQKGGRVLELPYPPSLQRYFARRVDEARGREYLFAGYTRGARQRIGDRPASRHVPWKAWRDHLVPVISDLRGARKAAKLTVAEIALRMGRSPDVVTEWETRGVLVTDRKGRPISLAHMRGTNITAKIRSGVSTKLAGASVGHEREETTKAYIGPLFDRLPEVAKVMDDYFEHGSSEGTKEAKRGKRRPAALIMGENLRRVREAKQLSQEELAHALGMHERTLRDIEKKGYASVTKAERWAQLLGVPLAALLEGVG